MGNEERKEGRGEKGRKRNSLNKEFILFTNVNENGSQT